jgi:dihydropteroate synthase
MACRSIHRAVEAGIHRNRIIIDPGLGFGKQAEDNLLLLKKLEKLKALKLPVLVGASRKSFIGKILDMPVGERLPGSLACVAARDSQWSSYASCSRCEGKQFRWPRF